MSISDESIMDSSSDDNDAIVTKRRRLTKHSLSIRAKIKKPKTHSDHLNIDYSDSDLESAGTGAPFSSVLSTANAKKPVSYNDIDDSDSNSSQCNSPTSHHLDSNFESGKCGKIIPSSSGETFDECDESHVGPSGWSLKERKVAPPIKTTKKSTPVVNAVHKNRYSSSSSSDSDHDDSTLSPHKSTDKNGEVDSPPGPLTQLLSVNVRKNVVPRHPNLAYPSTSSSTEQTCPRRSHPSTAVDRTASSGRRGQVQGKCPPTTDTPPIPPPVSSSKATRTFAGDELQQWRRCLWPGLASFYRVLLRAKCVPDGPSPPQSGTGSNDTSSNSHRRVKAEGWSHNGPSELLSATARDLHLEWGDIWDPAELLPVGLEFDR